MKFSPTISIWDGKDTKSNNEIEKSQEDRLRQYARLLDKRRCYKIVTPFADL